MPKSTPAEDPQNPEPVEEVALDEFCMRQSKTDRRVELIGGFYADEKRHQRVKDSEAAYRARFVSFATKPA